MILKCYNDNSEYEYISTFEKGKKDTKNRHILLRNKDSSLLIFYVDIESPICRVFGSDFTLIDQFKEISPIHYKFKNYNYYYKNVDHTELVKDLEIYKKHRNVYSQDQGVFGLKYKPTFNFLNIDY